MKANYIPWNKESLMVLRVMQQFNRDLRACLKGGDMAMYHEIKDMIADLKVNLAKEKFAVIVPMEGNPEAIMAYDYIATLELYEINHIKWYPINFPGIRFYKAFLNAADINRDDLRFELGILIAKFRLFHYRKFHSTNILSFKKTKSDIMSRRKYIKN